MDTISVNSLILIVRDDFRGLATKLHSLGYQHVDSDRNPIDPLDQHVDNHYVRGHRYLVVTRAAIGGEHVFIVEVTSHDKIVGTEYLTAISDTAKELLALYP